MTKHRTDVGIYGQPMPADWFQSLMEYVGSLASNVTLGLLNPTTVQLTAGTGSSQVALGINGRWRYNSVTTSVAHPGGAAGDFDVWAVASENEFAAGTSTPDEVDTTDYSFGLAIQAAGGAAPTGTYGGRPIAHTRKVGTLHWNGTSITDLVSTAGSGGGSAGAAPDIRILARPDPFNISNSNAETDLLNFTVPGGLMTAKGELHYYMYGRFTHPSLGGGIVATFRLYLAGTLIGSWTEVASGSNQTLANGYFEVFVRNAGSATSQRIYVKNATPGWGGNPSSPVFTATKDTSLDMNVRVTAQMAQQNLQHAVEVYTHYLEFRK